MRSRKEWLDIMHLARVGDSLHLFFLRIFNSVFQISAQISLVIKGTVLLHDFPHNVGLVLHRMLEQDHARSQRKSYKGLITILWAALAWGIGNFIVGLTAHHYGNTHSLFPAVDIALIDTAGGVIGLWIMYPFVKRRNILSPQQNNCVEPSFKNHIANPKFTLSGILKGFNTCFFVFSASYVATTESLIFESTYVLLSLILSILLVGIKDNMAKTLLKTIAIFIGIILVSGQNFHASVSHQFGLGLIFGLGAAISYAFFLLFWSSISATLRNLREQVFAAVNMLTTAFCSVVCATEIFSLIVMKKVWIPFTHLTLNELIIQFFNGVLVIGVVYLLLTIGLTQLRELKRGANIIAAIGLSSSIPLTLLPETIFGGFKPTLLQLLGIVVFMIGFVLVYSDRSFEAETADSPSS